MAPSNKLSYLLGLFILPLSLSTHAVTDYKKANIFDWQTFDNISLQGITPVPHPYDKSNDWPITFLNLDTHQHPTAVMLRESTAPLGGEKPYALNEIVQFFINQKLSLNFVFADFENKLSKESELTEMVNIIKNTPNHLINKAFIGNYNYSANKTNLTEVWGNYTEQAEYSQIYLNSGLNISMPVMYPYSAYRNHATRQDKHQELCINIEHALFWAPLERMSSAQRALPKGHLLIPWVGGFVDNGLTYPAPHPRKEDLRALVQHARLRGADGYYTWSHGGNKYYTIPSDELGSRKAFRDDMYQHGWKTLNPFFDLPGKIEVLNLETNKTGGIEWSGVKKGSHFIVLISNFTGENAQIKFPEYHGLPAQSPIVAPMSHLIVTY